MSLAHTEVPGDITTWRQPVIAIVQTRGAQACTRGSHNLTINLLSHETIFILTKNNNQIITTLHLHVP